MDDRWKGSLDAWKTTEPVETPEVYRCAMCQQVIPMHLDLESEATHHAHSCPFVEALEALDPGEAAGS